MQKQTSIEPQKHILVAIIGPPNAGKSTLFNAIIGENISIVTHKVQTTRFPIRGIINVDSVQLIFIDSPGMFKPKNNMEHVVHQNAQSVCQQELDYSILLLDASKRIGNDTKEQLKASIKGKTILVLNKIDRIPKYSLLKITTELQSLADFVAIFMISALQKDGISDLLRFLTNNAEQPYWLYPEDIQSKTDAPIEFIAAEITRKSLLINIHEEIPYSLFVQTEEIVKRTKSIVFFQSIYVTRETHKMILLGESGSTMERVRMQAEQELSEILSIKVHLTIFIKIKKDCLNTRDLIKSVGY